MMKKIITLLFAICLANNYWAQTGIITGPTYSSPAAASVPTLIKSPISVASGIPDVSFSLFSLATHSKNITVDSGIIYHPNNTYQDNGATEVGLGWGITNTHCVIYNESEAGAKTNIYYFTFLGRNGKFKINKDANNNWFVSLLTQNKLNIDLTTDSANEITKYTITDELGYKFIFDIQDKVRLSGIITTGGYFLSSIKDPKNSELLKYEYIEDNYNTSPPGNPIQIMAKNLKLSKIISHDFGSINFEYTFNAAQRNSYNDPFTLTYAILKNTAGKEIQKFGFQYLNIGYDYPIPYREGFDVTCQTQHISKRALHKLLKYSNSGSYEITEFGYGNYFLDNAWTEGIYQLGCLKNEYLNPKHFAPGILISTKLPTGSEIRYEYEPNQYFVNKNTSEYLTYFGAPEDLNDRDAQYYEYVTTVNFDSQNLNTFFLNTNPDRQDGASYLAYWYTVNEYYNDDLTNTTNTTPTSNQYVKLKIPGTETYSDNRVKCNAGFNNIEILGTGGKGTLTIMRIRYKTVPMRNFSTGQGVRVKTIDYYDNGTLVPALSRKYFYDKFDSPITSGILNSFDNNNSVVYKNVKEVIGNGTGYTKHYFLTIGDFIENLNADGSLKNSALKYTNILGKGLPLKKEIYDNNNTILASEENGYDFQEIPRFFDNKPAIIKKQVTTSKNISSSGTLTQISESVRDVKDYNITYNKTIAPDGTIIEESFTYPWNQILTDPRLYAAGIKDILLSKEVKRNGSVIAKTETKFDDVSHFYPTSEISFLPDNLSQSVKNVSYDIYDDKGNLVQFSTFPDAGSGGVPTTIIYGYHKTLPIAKIEGAKLSEIPASLITAIVNASNEDANATAAQEDSKEQALINALNSFKNDTALQNFMITCFTYNPLMGVTTTIPPNGMMELYKYDSFNRLLKTIDVNGNTIKEHQYNYKH